MDDAMDAQVNSPEPGPEEPPTIPDQALGAALEQVLAAVSAARGPTGPAGPAATPDGALTGPQVLAALKLLRELRTQIAGFEPELIDAARRLGTSWADLAPALGVASRQAAERRHLRLRPSASEDATTGEQRVAAERDKRAGRRAARSWARDNAADLRQLAGQITALTDMPGSAADDLAELREALGRDDAADLLEPLAGTRTHLRADGHAGLAGRVDAVGEQSRAAHRPRPGQRHTGS